MRISLWPLLALRFGVMSCALAVCLIGARADDTPAALARLLNDPATKQAVLENAREQNAQLPDACGSAMYTEASRAVVLGRPQLDATGKLIAGAWQQSVIATGCGARRQLNILTLVQGDGALRHIGLLPGTTIADPLLQRDAVRYATAAAAGLIPRDCHQTRIVDTRFAEFEGDPLTSVQPGRMVRQWREDWAIEACGKRVVIPVRFIPDPTGTTVVAGPRAASPR